MKSFLGFSFPDAVTWRVPVASQVSGVLDTMKKALILAAALGLTVGGAFAQDKGKGKGAAGDAKAGKEVFEGNCGVCHDTGTEARVGPGLKGVTKKPGNRHQKVQSLMPKKGDSIDWFQPSISILHQPAFC